MNNLDIRNVKTMNSTELLNVLLPNNPKYTKKIVNFKIKEMFGTEIDGKKILPSLNPNGTVAEYHLNKKQSLKFVAKWDDDILDVIVDFFIENKAKPLSLSQQLLYQAQINVDTERRLEISEEISESHSVEIKEIQDKLKDTKSRDIPPPKGFYSINTLKIELSNLMPKAHIEAIARSTEFIGRIRSRECKKYVSNTNCYETYTAYNEEDLLEVINWITEPNAITRVSKTKVRSAHYSSPFRHPM